MYAHLVDHLDPETANAREMLDAQLGVDDWRIPGVAATSRPAGVPTGAPTWWRGDEDASQAFMREMGVR